MGAFFGRTLSLTPVRASDKTVSSLIKHQPLPARHLLRPPYINFKGGNRMNAELIIKNLELSIKSQFSVQSEFRAVFHYGKRQKNVVTFDLIDGNQRRLEKNRIFAIVGSPRQICWYHGKNFWKLINLYATIRGQSIDAMNEHEVGGLIADCLNYYYRLYASIPPSLYYVH